MDKYAEWLLNRMRKSGYKLHFTGDGWVMCDFIFPSRPVRDCAVGELVSRGLVGGSIIGNDFLDLTDTGRKYGASAPF